MKQTALLIFTAALALGGSAHAATVGRVVPLGGHAADLALDERRGVLYVANFTGNQIDVVSLADLSVGRSMLVAPQPSSLSLSPDGRWLVVGHFGPYEAPSSKSNALTVINLETGNRETFGMASPVVGVAFTIDNQALVVSTTEFMLFDPVSGGTKVLAPIEEVTAKAFPAEQNTFPPQIVGASLATTRDGRRVFGLLDTFKSSEGSSSNIRFSYSQVTGRLLALGISASPPLGPRVVSVSDDASYYVAGWGMFGCGSRMWGDCDAGGPVVAQFPDPAGILQIGTHAIDSAAGILYAQLTQAEKDAEGKPKTDTKTDAPKADPTLLVLDADNLNVRERLRLPENMAGKSLLNAARDMLYSISDSGVMVVPVGNLHRLPRVAAAQEDVVFRTSFCERRGATQEVTIVDPGGGRTPFTLSTTANGIQISPSTGFTPATVRITVDPGAFQNEKGTSVANVEIRSGSAVNIPDPIRLLINTREPDQRGTFVNVPGKLVDLLVDPVRNRFYILRQDRNQVLVFDGTTYDQIKTLRTSNTPTQMAITHDRRYLLIGHDNSQLAYVYDLETFEQELPIRFRLGHYPRSIAVAGSRILAASRVAGPIHTIDKVDFRARTAEPLPTLGVYKNDVHINTVLAAAPNGGTIFAAMADGRVLLYNSTSDTFTISRKDFEKLGGAYGASSFGMYVAGDYILNSSLVPMMKMNSSDGMASSGFAFLDDTGFRTLGATSGPGVIQRVDAGRGELRLATRTAETFLLGREGAAFTRTVAPLYSRENIVALTTSGFTVLPWNYDAAVAPPRIDRLVNAADRTLGVAPGGLVTIFGAQLSPVNIATREMPLPTALGESCLTLNGIPMPVIFVSSSQINAQLPFNVDGNATLVLRTPGGVSDALNFTIRAAAPSVFRSATAGPDSDLPTIFRGSDNTLITLSNPVHFEDELVIFLTGMGRTMPAVDTGEAAPSEPLAQALIQPQVTLGGASLPVYYAGLTPGEVGVYQINVKVPFRGVPEGFDIPLTIVQGGMSTTVPVRVVK